MTKLEVSRSFMENTGVSSNMSLDVRSWKLKKYGRRTENGWIAIHDGTGDINLVLQTNMNFLIIQNSTVLESVPLLANLGSVEGFVKGDLLLIKFKNHMNHWRKFRVLFVRDNDLENLRRPLWDCVNSLRMYFPINDASVSRAESIAPIPTTTFTKIVKDIFTLKNAAAGSNVELFSQSAPLSESTVDDMVRLSLLDPTFPALVNSVEKSLKSLTLCPL